MIVRVIGLAKEVAPVGCFSEATDTKEASEAETCHKEQTRCY
jgi:hypothetical protein